MDEATGIKCGQNIHGEWWVFILVLRDEEEGFFCLFFSTTGLVFACEKVKVTEGRRTVG